MKARPGSSLLFAAFLVIGAAAYGQGAPASNSSLPRLSSKETAQRLAALPEDERKWLTDYVAPIILPEERDLFLQLTQPYQREMFKKEFWARREQEGLAAPLGPGYEKRYQQYRDAAATQYDGINSDAGRMVVRRGEPSSVAELTECSEVLRQAEVWTYSSPAGGSDVVQHIFYRPTVGAPRKLWVSGDSGIFAPASCTIDFHAACAPSFHGSPVSTANCASGDPPAKCPGLCKVAQISDGIKSRGSAESSLLSSPPAISTEGLDGLWNRLAGAPDPGAKPIVASNQSDSAHPVKASNVQTAPAAAPAQTAPAAAPAPAKPMSESERIKALPDDERRWLTEFVAPIMLPQEKKVYLELSEPYQREQFKEAFWERREQAGLPPPLGPGYR
ncbi:MAG TPA: GWxTD domain-containing protein, partial [Thermoanaerobaculia bacterium]|nr:GWxTD domain-containing protein [Thermoanaerobaculia bacterium]